jgi:hypothetical protein
MNGTKLFLTVFAAALLANLSADPLRALWQDYRAGAVPWLPRLVKTTADPAEPATARAGTATVTFKNTADQPARCWMRREGNYAEFLELDAYASKRFDAFNLGAYLRCAIWIDAGSSTVLTYFQAQAPGTYELRLSRVPCATCTGRDWRWATVVVNPNGIPTYNKLREQ